MKTYVQMFSASDCETLVDKINKYSETYEEEIVSVSVLNPNMAVVLFREKGGAE